MTIKDRNSRIAFNTVALYIRTFIVMVISFITARVMLKQLGVDDYGLNNLISGVVLMFNFLNTAMSTAVQRFYTVEEAREDGVNPKKIFGNALLLHLSIGAITLLMLEIFGIFFLHRLNIPADRMTVAQWVFQFTSLDLFMSIITVPSFAYLRAKEEFSKLAIVDVAEALCRLVILYLLSISPIDKLWTFSFLIFLLTIIYDSVIWIMAYRLYGDVAKPYISYEKKLFSQMMSFSLMLLFSVTSTMFYWQGIVVVINIFFGVAINAAYGIGNQVKIAVERFLYNFKQSIIPQLMGSQAAGEDERLYKLIYAATKITFVLSLLIAVPVIFEADFILKIWLETPPEFTTRFVQLCFIICILNSFSFFVIQAIQATGKVAGHSIVTSCSYILSFVAIYVFMKLGYDFYVPMYISIILAFVDILITLYYAKKTFDFHVMEFVVRIVGQCVVFCAIMVGCFLLLNHLMDEGWLRLCLNVALSGLLTLSSLYLLMNKAERGYILGYVGKIWRKLIKKDDHV